MKKKKIGIIAITVIFVLIISFWIRMGFIKRTDVALIHYSVSEDETEIAFDVMICSSMGYTRGYKDKEDGEAHYLTFYSTFGGFNSSFGAKSEFVLKLDEDDSEIYVYDGDHSYELVLRKHAETGEWERPVA